MGKFIKRFLMILFLLVVLVGSMVVFVGYRGYREAVKTSSLEAKSKALRTSEKYTKLEDISTDFKDAIVAIEDHRFYDHGGIDYISLVRITLANIMAQDVLGGGSTITQQLAKNFYFMESTSFTRKISEAFVAHDLEDEFSKEEILEMYINIIYYGDGYYGIYDASMGYFGVEPKDLTLAQSSMLAGLPQSPSIYALSNHNPASYKRQQEVLDAMLKYHYIRKTEYDSALQETIYP